MKKKLSKILIFGIILSIFLLPFSANLTQTTQNNFAVKIEENKARAEDWWFEYGEKTSGPGEAYIYYVSDSYGSEPECQAGRQAQKEKTTNNGLLFTTKKECNNGPKTTTQTNHSVGKTEPENKGIECTFSNFFKSCISAFIYNFIFTPLSWITAGTARLLDYFIHYSIQSTSYDKGFVETAWGIVRDLSNIFFIFALLYIGIRMILSQSVTDNKKYLGYIILIGLTINFSLFIVRVTIDASNILTRVFYAQIENIDSDGNTIPDDVKKEKSITVGLVSKFDPEKIIKDPNDKKNTGIFLMVTIVSIVLMCFMIYIFLSVALLFVARVASLWLAMIFAPLAFASYTVPFKIPEFGHQEFWGNLFKSAFLAPVFVFLLYVIGTMGDALKSISYDIGSSTDTIDNIMKVVIPFLIIFILLQTAKKIAVKFSGDMGAMFQKAPLIAGLGLGVASAGVGFAGRNILGRISAGASRTDKAKEYSEKRLEYDKEFKAKNFTGTWKEYKESKGLKFGIHEFGGKVNYSREKINQIEHGRHELEDYKKKAGLENVATSNLSGTDEKKIEKTFEKENKSSFESMVTRGKDAAGNDVQLYDATGTTKLGLVGRDAWELRERANVVSSLPTGSSEAEIKNELNKRFEDILKSSTTKLKEEKWKDLNEKAKQDMGVNKRLYAGSTSGSYDPRQIGPKFSNKDGFGTKALNGLTLAVAMGIRSGMKTIGANPGPGKGDFMTDMGNLITTALKGAKINVASGAPSHDNEHGKGLGGHGGGGHH